MLPRGTRFVQKTWYSQPNSGGPKSKLESTDDVINQTGLRTHISKLLLNAKAPQFHLPQKIRASLLWPFNLLFKRNTLDMRHWQTVGHSDMTCMSESDHHLGIASSTITTLYKTAWVDAEHHPDFRKCCVPSLTILKGLEWYLPFECVYLVGSICWGARCCKCDFIHIIFLHLVEVHSMVVYHGSGV
jgi:hypothetical protein